MDLLPTKGGSIYMKLVRTGAALVSLLGLACSVTFGQASPTPAEPVSPARQAQDCKVLAGMKVEAGTVQSAEIYSAGQTIKGGETAGAKVSTSVCRVRLRLQPTPGSDINVEVWLPQRWNGKLYGIGGAGFDGGLSPGGAAILDKAAVQGYASVATDVGHKPAPTLQTWVHGQPERVVDFGHRGNHLAAVVAKQVVVTHYGEPARRAYFLACSNGGRDGLMAASRYPEDYDGIVAGAPARRYLEVLTLLIWYHQAVHGPGGAPKLESKLGLVNDTVLKKCDALDGVKDGVLENPLRCNFDPAELQCKEGDSANCLTSAEVEALRKIYGGPRLSNGEQIYSGPVPGSEVAPAGWTAWITSPQVAVYGQEFYRWIVYDDPKWTVEDFDIDRDYRAARERIAPIINAEDPDISAFARRGGKLIMYQGWYDPAITPADTIRYYEEMRRRLGPDADDHVRLFMVPGMGHCAGGPGATQFDMQPVLENWVEQGEAPDRVIAVKPDSGNPPLSRPLCPWPKTASYDGSGSTADAANFACKVP